MNKQISIEKDIFVAFVCFIACMAIMAGAVIYWSFCDPAQFPCYNTMKERQIYWLTYDRAKYELGLSDEDAHKAAEYELLRRKIK